MSWVFKFDVDDDGIYEITLTGAVIKSIQEELNGEEQATFEIPNTVTNQGYIANNVDFQVLYDGNSIFEGVCTGGQYTAGMIECIGYNKVYELMQKRDHTGSYEAESASSILTQICTDAGVTANFAAAGFPGGVAPTVGVRFDSALCYDSATFLAAACIGDFWSSGGDTFHIAKERGSYKGALTTFTVSRRGIDRSKQRDKVKVIGVDADGNRLEETYGAGSDIAIIRTKKASDSTTLANLAEEHYDQLNTETSGSSINVPVGDAYDIYPGDTVTLNSTMYNLSGVYRVWKITKDIAFASIEIDRPNFTYRKAIENMMAYEDLGIYVVDVSVIPPAILPWTSDIIIEPYNPPGSGDKHNVVRWGASWPSNANVHFANGDDQEILAGDSKSIYGVFSDGIVYYLYFTIGDNTMNITTNYQTATGPNKGLLAICYISFDTDQQVGIDIYHAGGVNVISDWLGDGAATNAVITAEQIYGKDIRTSINVGTVGGPAGVRMTGVGSPSGLPPGIYGYSGGTTIQFYLDALDGKGYFAGGDAYIDSNGIHIIKDNLDYIRFYKAGPTLIGRLGTGGASGHLLLRGNQQGNIYVSDALVQSFLQIDDSGGLNDGRVYIASSSSKPILLAPSGDVEVWTADIIPRGTLGNLGSATYYWTEGYIDSLIVGDGVDSGRLKIPRISSAAGEAAAGFTDGDIWLRTDL